MNPVEVVLETKLKRPQLIALTYNLRTLPVSIISAIDVQETCKEVKDSLSELLLDYDEYAFHSSRIIGENLKLDIGK